MFRQGFPFFQGKAPVTLRGIVPHEQGAIMDIDKRIGQPIADHEHEHNRAPTLPS